MLLDKQSPLDRSFQLSLENGTNFVDKLESLRLIAH